MNIYIGHRHYWGNGYIFAYNSMGEIEPICKRVCLDSRCRKHQIWFDKKWWDTLEYQWPKNLFVHGQYI